MSFDPHPSSASPAADNLDRPARDLSSSSSASLGSRRGLTPLSTQLNTSATRQHSPFSPPSHSANPSYAAPSGSRSRTLTSSSQAASHTTHAGYTSRLSRASPSISSSLTSPTAPIGSGAPGAGQSGNNLAKIVIAQIFLLLSTIKDDNYAEKIEQIQVLLKKNGMDVYTKYFRRLILTNASQIWSQSRGADSGSYQVLVDEMSKVTREADQAGKIAESIESGDGDMFKDFDLSTFMEHFKMSPTAKVTLASAFKRASKADLRTKADAILSNNIQTFINALGKPPQTPADDLPANLIATVLDRLAQSPPRNWTSDLLASIRSAVQRRFSVQEIMVPLEISSSLYMFNLLSMPPNGLVRTIQKHGSRFTENEDSCRTVVGGISPQDLTPDAVANTLLFMVIAADEPRYKASTFVSVLRDHPTGGRLDWNRVIKSMDREGLRITQSQFKSLFDALMIPAQAVESFDIQPLWGGNLWRQAEDEWHNLQTLLTFTAAFLSFKEDELDASQIPRLRTAYSLKDFEDASPEVKDHAKRAIRSPLVSLDAAHALLNLVFRSSETYNQAQAHGIVENIINPKMDLFICAVAAVPKPWAPLQDQAMKQLIVPMFHKSVATHAFVFHLLWKKDKEWLSDRLVEMYNRSNLALELVFDHAQRHGWLQVLVDQLTELSLDLAALAHGRNEFDIQVWLQDLSKKGLPMPRLRAVLTNFLRSRADDEASVNKEGAQPRHIPLTIKTVYAILRFLGDADLEDDSSVPFHRQCITAYPRLINYGEGLDEVIDTNGANGNALSPDADARMQEHYKDMYSGQSEVRNIVEALQRYKGSEEPGEQDLFACMIFGLFDEYNCFGEYPLDALATTAVLFGSIINFDLLSRIAQKAALGMVLEAVRDYPPEESMFKFGLQALLHFSDQLPNWKAFTQALAQVPHLQGSQIWPQIERVLQDDVGLGADADMPEDTPEEATNSALMQEPRITDFTCFHVDQSSNQEQYEEPDEHTQESVLFVLNNTTDVNLDEKMKELGPKLRVEHIQWFAHFLVDQRVKSQPNFHQLYMNLLEKYNNKALWTEILRETYVAAFRMLNAESTLHSSTERGLLKNLALWLGSLTLARGRPILYKNLSFKDLLIEAHDTQRLTIAIPFTCNVLTAAAKSVVFQPPCSWTMELLQILAELYDFAGLKLQHKFEIEILYKALGVEDKDIERSEAIRSRPPADEDVISASLTDVNVEGFGDLSFTQFGRRGLAERLSPSAMPELSDLTSVLRHNYTLGNANQQMQGKVRQMLTACAERAVAEIVGPVVERSVTIAAISTSQLVAKDFVLERDATKFQESSHGLVRSLAARLALVTCKEPLRQALIAHIRQMVRELPDPNMLQDTTIILFVNDNIEAVCSIIEKAAENASVQEIDMQIEEALRARREGSYQEPPLNRWSFAIPEPYRLSQGGLNRDQLAIYEDFDRLARGSSSLANNLSQDSVRQLPDVLQDQYSSMPPMSTPGEVPSLPRQIRQSSGTSALPTPVSAPHHLVNGYGDPHSLSDRVPDLVTDILRTAQDVSNLSNGQVSHDVMFEAVRPRFLQLQGAIRQAGPPVQQDALAWTATSELRQNIYTEGQPQAVVDILCVIVAYLCNLSDSTSQAFFQSLQAEPERLFHAAAAAGFVKSGLIDVKRIDHICASAIKEQSAPALEYFSQIIDVLLLAESNSRIMRADFSHSINALWEAHTESPLAKAIIDKLEQSDPIPSLDEPGITKEHQMRYAFDEWCHLLENDAQNNSIAFFVHSMQKKHLLTTREDMIRLFWTCIDSSVIDFEKVMSVPGASPEDAYERTDALARLIVAVITWHGSANGGAKQDKVDLFHRTLSTVALVLVRHFQVRDVQLNGKVFHRLFSVTLCELVGSHSLLEPYMDNLILGFGRSLLLVPPREFPFFSFSWVSLISHRLLLPGLIRSSDPAGQDVYVDLLVAQLEYVSELLKPYEVSVPARDMYRGTMKLLLVLHHDFPQFLVENHYRLTNAVAVHCTQMRNLILSAVPINQPQSGLDPFIDGAKERMDDQRRVVVKGDLSRPLIEAGVLEAIDECLEGNGSAEQHVDIVANAITSPERPVTGIGLAPAAVNNVLINALLLYIVQHAETTSTGNAPLAFSPQTPHGKMIDGLMERLTPEARFYLVNAMMNQLRFPNPHTNFFGHAILHVFHAGELDALINENQQIICRVFLERLVTSRPHPWGLIATMMELLKNPAYDFWSLNCVKALPDVENLFVQLFQQMNQSSRTMA